MQLSETKIAAVLWLAGMGQFQQMRNQHLTIALQRMGVAAGQIFYLLGKIIPVQLHAPALAQQARLLQCP